MTFHEISRKIIYALIAIWLGSIVWGANIVFQYVFLGAIVFYVGVQNLILLQNDIKNKTYSTKLEVYIDKFGFRNGVIYYGVFSIGLFMFLGVMIILSGFHLQG